MMFMDIDTIRRENAKILAKQCGSKAALADKIDRSPAQIGHIIGKTPSKNIGKDLARHIEGCFRLPEYWMDEAHTNQVAEPRTTYGATTPAHKELTEVLQSILSQHPQEVERLTRVLRAFYDPKA